MNQKQSRVFGYLAMVPLLVMPLACGQDTSTTGSGDSTVAPTGTGGAPGTGGANAGGGATGVGGAQGTGGANGGGGANGTGGVTASGGLGSTGGVPGTGGSVGTGGATGNDTAEPVNPKATPQTRAVLSYLRNLMGKGVLTGQHDYVGTTGQASSIATTTGTWPAVWGSDFAYGSGVDSKRQSMVKSAIDMWNKGALITLTYHEVRPIDDESCGWSCVQTSITDAEYLEIVTPGSALNLRWIAQIDNIAGYLKQLQNAGVVVIWRPYHEKNLKGFWWCRREVAKLHQLMYDRFTNYHKLNNLLWNWNFNAVNQWAVDPTPWFPGIAYVDMISIDDYANTAQIPGQGSYDIAKKLAQGKPLAIGEQGMMVDPSFVKNSRPDIVYFLTWPLSDPMVKNNTPAWVKSVYSNSYAITRDEVPLPLRAP